MGRDSAVRTDTRSSMKLNGCSLEARQVSNLLNLGVTILDGLPSEALEAWIGSARHDSRVYEDDQT